MRTITAPGVEIKEIDKSQYSPAMVGTACYVMGFANKGEAYIPMEFTSRAAWLSYYGEPATEAEKYFYNACVEVLNQNGRLYCARLPYDNESFEKMVAYKYDVIKKELTAIGDTYNYADITAVDNSISTVGYLSGSSCPELVELTDVDEYRTDEKKVANGKFMIVDKTCGSYNMIQEDYRKGKAREILGIVPVVTTAANAMYAQKLINVEKQNAKYYESIGSCYTLSNLTDGISCLNDFNQDLVRQLNSTYKGYHIAAAEGSINSMNENITGIRNSINAAIATCNKKLGVTISELGEEVNFGSQINTYNDIVTLSIAQVWNSDQCLSTLTSGDKFIQEISTLSVDSNVDTLTTFSEKAAKAAVKINAAATWHSVDGDDALPNTVSFEANDYFVPIQYNSQLSAFDRTNLKKIGVVVYKTYIDPSEGNKIAFEPVESFVGSLQKNDKDINTGITTFIDTIINTQSKYIYFFSNCFNTTAAIKTYNDDIDMMIAAPTGNAGLLGFYSDQVKADISLSKSIYDGMDKCFEKVADINQLDIDIVPDAGIANIASFIASLKKSDNKFEYDLNALSDPTKPDSPTVVSLWWPNVNRADDVSTKTWKTVEMKFDNFCKNIRKDCMFIADGLRPLVIQGNKKVIRPSKPKNNIDVDILPYVKFMTGLNTNYGAGYIDWFEIADEFTGDFFWCPPSIKAMGVYIYTDSNFQYWDAPAGLNRGVIAATDVAFSPTGKQAGSIYEKNWNYAINYPQDGIVLEGQKTFQVKPSAFDRVNVRRLFLRLERAAYRVARYFVYEGNTAYTRQRLVDALDPYFKEAKVGGGVYDYKIICDESINDATTIDRNELKVKIGIKPTKTAEFILIDFIAVSTGGSFEEAMA